jgi:hypothetical protein
MTNSKEYAAKWRQRNRERTRAYLRMWRATNPERVKAIQDRRAQKMRKKPYETTTHLQ